MPVVRPLVVMAHGEPRFFCSCGEEMRAQHGRRFMPPNVELVWYACPECGSITQEIEVGAVATTEAVA